MTLLTTAVDDSLTREERGPPRLSENLSGSHPPGTPKIEGLSTIHPLGSHSPSTREQNQVLSSVDKAVAETTLPSSVTSHSVMGGSDAGPLKHQDLLLRLTTSVANQLKNGMDLTIPSLMNELRRFSENEIRRNTSCSTIFNPSSPPPAGESLSSITDSFSQPTTSSSNSPEDARTSRVLTARTLLRARRLSDFHLPPLSPVDPWMLPSHQASPSPAPTRGIPKILDSVHSQTVSSPHSLSQLLPVDRSVGPFTTLARPLLSGPTQTRAISASTDPVIVDQVTAAAINLQNRGECDDEEVDRMGEEEKEGEVQNQQEDPQDNKESTEEDQVLTEGTDSFVPLDLLPFQGMESGPPSSKTRRHRSSGDAWRKFSMSTRKLEQPSCSYTDRLPGGSSLLKRRGLLHQLMLQEAGKNGKYVQWCPSTELAFTCAEPEVADAARILSKMIVLRNKFVYPFADCDAPSVFPPSATEPGVGSAEPLFDPYCVKPLPPCTAQYRMEEGIYTVYWSGTEGARAPRSSMTGSSMYNGEPLLHPKTSIPDVTTFLAALRQLMAAVQDPACKTFTYRRLEYLRNRFDMHVMFNAAAESQETKENKHRDFYNVRKVDTHVHHSASMHQKQLLRFIRMKFRTEPDEYVARTAEGQLVTLREIFEKDVGIPAYDLSIDSLNVHALGSCFHRFDLFNTKYNPFGQALLREVFLKSDNLLQGRYLAEMTKEVISDLEDAKYQFVEWRVSIYGRNRHEWARMAKWISDFGLTSKNVRWMIQVPRLYHVYRKLNLIRNFGELLSNIFEPLFEAVKDPESHPQIYHFLLQMNGWDSVDDESVVSKYTTEGGALPLPEDWSAPSNPPYSYWGYYMYANIQSLNQLLCARGMRTLPFRPHCGETGSISHLASMFLLADGVNHGILLRKSPVLQYLYYLQQIGLAVSPLSNNALFHAIAKNPFFDFFRAGLNLSLSTDDPLMFHFTDEALLEEYSCCAHVWRLSTVDLCEIARNSVLQSHFEPQFKRHWLGANYTLSGRRGNSITHSNVSNIRIQYREDVLLEELKYLCDVLRLQEISDECV